MRLSCSQPTRSDSAGLFVVCLLGYRLMDAGRLFSTDSSSSLKKDPTVAHLKSFTQV